MSCPCNSRSQTENHCSLADHRRLPDPAPATIPVIVSNDNQARNSRRRQVAILILAAVLLGLALLNVIL